MTDRDIALALIQVADLPILDDDLEALISAFPLIRDTVALLHAMPEARYEDSSSVFLAEPAFVAWSS